MSRARTRRRKRCAECKELFRPDLRVGSRQRHCSGAACQKARKRDYQRRWREAHPSEERGRRLREVLSGSTRVEPRPREPLSKVPWDEVETEMGREASVVLMFVLGIVVRWLDTRPPPPR